MDRVQKDIQPIIADKALSDCLQVKRIFITGATGLIGSMLARTLHAADLRYGLHLKLIGQIRNREKA